MATLYISEYADLPFFNGRTLNIAVEPPIAEQTVAIGGSHAESSAFNGRTQLIRVHTDAICSISIGANPVATAAMKRLAANQTEYFAVATGGSNSTQYKLSVITNT